MPIDVENVAGPLDGALQGEFQRLLRTAQAVSEDVGGQVEEILALGLEAPLQDGEAMALLGALMERLAEVEPPVADIAGVAEFARRMEDLAEQVLAARQRLAESQDRRPARRRVILESVNGIEPRPVLPTPVFHGRRVPVVQGFVRTAEINLWDLNERIDIHLAQFQKERGRVPEGAELLDIMLSQSELAGVTKDDEFKIIELARSIAANGVREPPIIDLDGTLLDGNRRVTACYYILGSAEFTAQEKARVERIVVWQLTDHATDADRDAVVVSLNFEDNHKLPWPEYVKATKVYEVWQDMLTVEPRLTRKRSIELRRELARRFALGDDLGKVSRYIDMMELAVEFEDHHVVERARNAYEVKHHAAESFQYFDELGKGTKPGGVNYALNQDPLFKGVVFDLLYDGKFNNWREIRALKLFPTNAEAMAELRRARDEDDVDAAQEMVEGAVGIVNSRSAQQRQKGVNTRIEAFADWFLDLPLKSFEPNEPGAITQANLERLSEVFQLVQQQLATPGRSDAA